MDRDSLKPETAARVFTEPMQLVDSSAASSGPQAAEGTPSETPAEATPSETPSCAPSMSKSKLRVTTGRVCVPTPRVRNFSVLVGGDRSPSPKRVSFDQSCATKQHGRVGSDVKRLSPPLRREV